MRKEQIRRVSPWESQEGRFIAVQRLGRTVGERPRPLHVTFACVSEKHCFLQYSSDLRVEDIRIDDDLTRKQQQEREELSNDFVCLKAKGYRPYFRGSQLKYCYKDKTQSCKQRASCCTLQRTQSTIFLLSPCFACIHLAMAYTASRHFRLFALSVKQMRVWWIHQELLSFYGSCMR